MPSEYIYMYMYIYFCHEHVSKSKMYHVCKVRHARCLQLHVYVQMSAMHIYLPVHTLNTYSTI